MSAAGGSFPRCRSDLIRHAQDNRRGDKVVFEKPILAKAAWPSDYFADMAVPDAMHHYVGLFAEVSTQLFAAADLRRAARAG